MQTLKCLGSSQCTTCFNLCGIASVAKDSHRGSLRGALQLRAITLALFSALSYIANYDRYVCTMGFYEASVVKLVVKSDRIVCHVCTPLSIRRLFAKLIVRNRFALTKVKRRHYPPQYFNSCIKIHWRISFKSRFKYQSSKQKILIQLWTLYVAIMRYTLIHYVR